MNPLQVRKFSLTSTVCTYSCVGLPQISSKVYKQLSVIKSLAYAL